MLWRCLLAAVVGVGASHAQSAGELTTDIPAQPLAGALAAFARQSGLELVYVSKLVQGQSSPGAPAGLAPRAALAHLLEGTGLQFEFLNERSVRIYAAPPHTTAQHGILGFDTDFAIGATRGFGCL
jgi:hypothetical protein